MRSSELDAHDILGEIKRIQREEGRLHATGHIDFYVRHNTERQSYDWKPVSDRAQVWIKTHYSFHTDHDGWL